MSARRQVAVHVFLLLVRDRSFVSGKEPLHVAFNRATVKLRMSCSTSVGPQLELISARGVKTGNAAVGQGSPFCNDSTCHLKIGK